MRYILETERLRLREFTLDDTAFILELLNSPGWLRFIGDRNVRTEQDAIHYLEKGPLKSYQDYGYGLSLVVTKDDNCPVGMCGIINRAYLKHPDIGFAFLPDFTGLGYASEIAAATLAHAKEALNLENVSAITLPENTSSIKLLEKIGLTFTDTITLPDSTEELLLYHTNL